MRIPVFSVPVLRRAAVLLPWSQPPTSPGLTTTTPPSLRTSALCVCPKTRTSYDGSGKSARETHPRLVRPVEDKPFPPVSRLVLRYLSTGALRWETRNLRPSCSKTSGASTISPISWKALARPGFSPSQFPKTPFTGQARSRSSLAAKGATKSPAWMTRLHFASLKSRIARRRANRLSWESARMPITRSL